MNIISKAVNIECNTEIANLSIFKMILIYIYTKHPPQISSKIYALNDVDLLEIPVRELFQYQLQIIIADRSNILFRRTREEGN